MPIDPTRVLLERLVDELDELERIVWKSDPPRELLREQAGTAMAIACAALDSACVPLGRAVQRPYRWRPELVLDMPPELASD